MAELKNPMTVYNYWKIRRQLMFIGSTNGGCFEQMSHEELTEMILNDPDTLEERLEAIIQACKEIKHDLSCEDCKSGAGSGGKSE